MKPKFPIASYLSLVSVIALTATSQGAALTWDTVAGDTTTITAGSGTWNTSAVAWNNAGADVAWTQTSATVPLNSAIFGGADGTYAVTVGSGIATSGLTFNNSGYTLSATAAQTITLTGATLTLAADKTASIGTSVLVTPPTGTALSIAGAGTLNIGGTGARVRTLSNNISLTSGPVVNVNTGGTLSSDAQLVLGTSTSSNSLVVNGGTVTVGTTGTTASGAQNIVVYNATAAGASTLTLNSGTVTNLGTGKLSGTESGLRFGPGAVTTNAVSATVNLNGGTLTAARVYEGNTGAGLTSTFNFNGGLLKVTSGAGNAANYMTGLDTASVKSGGARIDTNGVETTIAQALLDGGGGGGLTKEGNGTLNLTGANTYTGATTISGGKIGITAPYSSLTATTINANTRLRVTTGATASPVSSVTINANGGFETNVGTYTVGQLSGLAVTNFNAAGDYKIDLNGTGVPAGDITVLTYTSKTGTGVPSLGNLPVGVIGTVEDTGSAIVIHAQLAYIWAAGTGNWDTTTANWTGLASTYTDGNPVAFPEIAGSNTVTLTADRSPSSVTIANDSTSTYTFTGSAIAGATNVNKVGSGIATFDTANSYTGTTTVSSGGIIANANGALGSETGGSVISGGGTSAGAVLGLTNGVNYSTPEPISGSGIANTAALGVFIAAQRGFVQAVSGNCTFAGPIEINAAGVSRLGVQDGAQLTLSGPITKSPSVTGVSVLFRAGANDGDFITLANSNNSWDGLTTIFANNAGTGSGLKLGIDNGVPITSSVVAGGGSSGSANQFDLNGYDQILDGLPASNGTLHILNKGTSPSTLTLRPAADKSSFSATTLTTIEDGTDKILLVKDGNFKQTLHGTHTYTGSTTISAGTLALTSTGTIDNTASIEIGAGATFDISAKTTYAVPAATPFTLKLDGADTGSSGKIKAAGLDITNAAVTFSSVTAPDDSAYILADYTSLTGTSFASVTGLPSGYTIDYAYNGGTQIALVQNALSGYALWISTFPAVGSLSLPGDDADSDGVKNLVEYVLNGNPTVSDSSSLPTLAVTATDFDFTFSRRDDSLSPITTQTFQYSKDLVTWTDVVIPSTPGTVGAATITVTDTGITDSVKVSIPKTEAAPGSKLFGRLNIVKP